MAWLPRFADALLASGDGDFDLLVNKIRQDFGVSVEVYGVTQLTAMSLINSASKFVSIEGDLLLNNTKANA